MKSKMVDDCILSILFINVLFHPVLPLQIYEAGTCKKFDDHDHYNDNNDDNDDSCKSKCSLKSDEYGLLIDSKCTAMILFLSTSKCVCYFDNTNNHNNNNSNSANTTTHSFGQGGNNKSQTAATSESLSMLSMSAKNFTTTTKNVAPFQNLYSTKVSTFETTSTSSQITTRFPLTLTASYQPKSSLLSNQSSTVRSEISTTYRPSTSTDTTTKSSHSIVEDKLTTPAIPKIQNTVAIVGGLAGSFAGMIVISVILCKSVSFCQGPQMSEFVPTII